jgi:hypothetical protein
MIKPMQAEAASQIDSIGNDAGNIASQVTTPFGTSPASSGTAVVEPAGGTSGAGSYFDAYDYLMSTLGNLGGNFWGDVGGISVEQSTATNFTSTIQSSRADFYQLMSVSSGSEPGTYLGYFDLSTNGVLTYTAGSSAVPPMITGITTAGGTNTITFTTLPGGLYNLVATNAAGLFTPVATWPVLAPTAIGTGSPAALTDVSSDGSRIYAVREE